MSDSFDFGYASSLYRENQHPRVFLGTREVLDLRQRVRSGLGRRIMVALRAKAEGLVEVVRDSRDVAQTLAEGLVAWDSPGSHVLFGLHDLAMQAVVDEDADSIGAACRVLSAMPEANGAAHMCLGSYGTQRPFAVACAYDLVHGVLEKSERVRCARWLAGGVARGIPNELRPSFFRAAGGNVAVERMLTALAALLAVDGDTGVPDLSRERAELLSFYEASLHTAIGPNGYPEEDIGYGTMVVAKQAQMASALRRAGIFDAYETCPRLVRFGRAMLHFVQPWGEFLAVTGDRGDDFQQRELVLARLAERTNDPTLIWLLGTLHGSGLVYPESREPHYEDQVPLSGELWVPASAFSLIVLGDLSSPAHPSRARPGLPTSFHDPGRGIVSFRSGWQDDATFLVFDGSQRGTSAQGHPHASCGHFSLSALGEYFAIDTGRYNNEQDQHNLVLVNGKSGRTTDGNWTQMTHHGLLTAYTPGGLCDFASADSSHQHDRYWARRSIGLVKGEGAPAYVWTVEDVHQDREWGEYWWCLNTCPENLIRTYTRKATITGWRGGNHLDVHFVRPPSNSHPRPRDLTLTQDQQSTSSHQYIRNPVAQAERFERPSDMVHRSAYVRPRLIAKLPGYDGRFMSLMIPRRHGEKPAGVRPLKSIDNSLAVRISFPDYEDTLIFAYEHHLLEAGGVKARGPWCVERRSRASGRVVEMQLGQ